MDLKGWDTVSLVSMETANKQMAADQSQLVESFSFTEDGYKIDGNFGSWAFIAGGSGRLLHLQLPIKTGSLAPPGGTSPLDLAGVAVVVEVDLQLLPDPPDKPTGTRLAFNFKTAGTADSTSGGGVVKPITVLDPSKKLGKTNESILSTAVIDSLVTNGAKITYNIAMVGVVDQEKYGWIKPVSKCTQYAYVETAAKKGYLAILSVVTDRATDKLALDIDPSLLDEASNGIIAITGALFLEHVIQPQMPAGIGHGTTASTFKFNPANQHIESTAAFGLGKVEPALIPYYPRATSLSLYIKGDEVECDVSGDCDMGLGISLSFSVQQLNTLKYDAATKSISFVKAASPEPTSSADVPWYDYVIAGAVMPVAAAVFAIVTAAVSDSLGSAVTTSANAQIAADPPAPVQWAGLKALSVSSIDLDSAFVMRGALS